MQFEIFVFGVLVFLISFLFVYPVFPRELLNFRKIDFLLLYTFVFLVIGRIWAVFINFSDIFNVSFSLFPIVGVGDRVYYFSKWPWIFFRFWDGYFVFDYIFFTLVVFLVLMYLFIRSFRGYMYRLSNVFTILVLSIFIFNLLGDVFLDIFFIRRDISFLVSDSFVKLYFYLILFIMNFLGFYIVRYYSSFLFVWILAGIYVVLASVLPGRGSDFSFLNIFFLEGLLVLVLGVVFICYEFFYQQKVVDRMDKVYQRRVLQK